MSAKELTYVTAADRQAALFGPGTLAFLDAFAGMVPCVVREVRRECFGFRLGQRDELLIELTETVGAYTKGELLERSAFRCPPRVMRRQKQYSSTILPDYVYRPDGENQTVRPADDAEKHPAPAGPNEPESGAAEGSG